MHVRAAASRTSAARLRSGVPAAVSQHLPSSHDNIGRYNGNVGTGPTFSRTIDLTSMPVNPAQAVQPGEDWNFQAWYRDVGNTSNFTDGLNVLFN